MAGRLITTWALAVCGGTALATNLYTTHYGGNVSTLSLTECNGSYTLTKTHTLKSCGMMPSWLTYDTKTEILYCSDENSPNGTLTTYAVAEDGAFTELAEVTTIAGGVNSVEYGGISGNSFLAIAHYQGSAVSTFALPITNSSKAAQVFPYKLAHPGPNPVRQDAPHPHEVILDPTRNFILSPDLGADQVHIFSVDNATGILTPYPSHNATPGSGPRHAAFKVNGNKTFMYLASELGNNITAFEVTYPSTGGLAFQELERLYPFPGAPPAGSAVGEIRVVGNNVYNSNRNTSAALIDSLTTFNLSPTTGDFTFQNLTSTYGSWPRTFVVNKAGTLVAIGDQDSGSVVIVGRDCETGVLGPELASVVVGPTGSNGNGGLSSVIFGE